MNIEIRTDKNIHNSERLIEYSVHDRSTSSRIKTHCSQP